MRVLGACVLAFCVHVCGHENEELYLLVETSNAGVCQGLGYDHQANGETCNGVTARL